jgi:DNA-binding beta-propeller fold protein YncE
MRVIFLLLTLSWTALPVLGQRPSIPLQAIGGPDLGYRPVDVGEAFEFPAGMGFESVAAVDIDSKGHIYVLHRAEQALMEFDPEGRFVRAFGEGLFNRSHGLRLDAEDNLWVTDVNDHVVMKLSQSGDVLLTLGQRGEAGEWDEAAGSRLFNQPTDVAIGPNGNIFVTQGHGPAAEPRVLKFDTEGNFVTSWGGRGTLPWQFEVAHSLVIDPDGLVYVADRENRRVQVFDLDGNFVKGWLYKGMACGLFLSADGHLYLATGFDAQIVKLDQNGVVLGVVGRSGEGLGEFGEAHFLAVDDRENIYVADVVNRRVQKLEKR